MDASTHSTSTTSINIHTPNTLFVLDQKIHCAASKLFICDRDRNSISTGTRVGLSTFSYVDDKKFTEFMQAATDSTPGVEVSFYDSVDSFYNNVGSSSPRSVACDPETLVGTFATEQVGTHFCIRYKFMEGVKHYVDSITYVVNDALIQRLDKLRRWFSDYDLKDEIECAENMPVEKVVFMCASEHFE